MRSIRYSDDNSWHDRRLYSGSAAYKLATAYASIHKGGDFMQSYWPAYIEVAPLRDVLLLDEQRLRVLYVLSMAYTADEGYGEALRTLHEAILIAARLGDRESLAELLYLRGSIYGCIGKFQLAGDDYRASLTLRRELALDGPPSDPEHEITLLAGAAGFDYYLGDFKRATAQLREARHISAYVPDASTSTGVASINWIWSHLYRSKGRLAKALDYAMRAAETYTNQGNPASAARIQWLVAEIALDQAASFGDNSSSQGTESYLKLARSYINGARDFARAANDPIGRAMASLPAARRDWLTKANTDTPAELQRAERVAIQRQDTPLRGQVYLAMGGEREARGDVAAARGWYRKAIVTLDNANVQALQAAARRALHHLDEGHPPL